MLPSLSGTSFLLIHSFTRRVEIVMGLGVKGRIQLDRLFKGLNGFLIFSITQIEISHVVLRRRPIAGLPESLIRTAVIAQHSQGETKVIVDFASRFFFFYSSDESLFRFFILSIHIV